MVVKVFVKNKKNIHVVGAVIIANNHILCAQRGKTKTLPYKWEFPGGKIEQYESAEEALKREIEEEMQIKIEVSEQIEHTVHEYNFGIVHLTTFYCTILEGRPILTEHQLIKWLKVEELPSLDWAPADIPVVEKIINLEI
jgi:8-oxo-dGTP diphosphatase